MLDSGLVLVGYYREKDGLNRAVAEFAAASFGYEDAVFVHASDTAESSWWARIRAWLRDRFVQPAAGPHRPAVAGTEELLAVGGGLVLVRCPARFHTACDIIERTGGQIGMARRAAA